MNKKNINFEFDPSVYKTRKSLEEAISKLGDQLQPQLTKDLNENLEEIDKNLIDRVYKYASIKNIWDKNSSDDEKIMNILSLLLIFLKIKVVK